MKKIVSGITFTALSFTTMLIAAPVMASTYTGTVQTLRFSTGTSAARVSVSSTQATSCGQQWYGIENADSGVGKIWTAALLAAKGQGKTIVITGTGTCDGWGVEPVNYIDVQ